MTKLEEELRALVERARDMKAPLLSTEEVVHRAAAIALKHADEEASRQEGCDFCLRDLLKPSALAPGRAGEP